MRLTIRHHYDFGADRDRVGAELNSAASWDALRETAGPFGLPESREEWEAAARRPELAARAEAVARMARELGARRVCSYGVGAAFLELNLARAAPELELVCTDYAPRAVERLAALFPEATVLQHDLLTEEPVAADLHLLHRVDTELSNEDWPKVLARFEQPVLVLASELLGLKGLLRELALRVPGRRLTRAGYVRSEPALRALWRGTHDDRRVQAGDLAGFLLTRRG